MTEINVRARLLRDGAYLPFRATPSASGFDLFACITHPIALSQVPTVVGTGVALEVPDGFDAQIRPRSGLARRGVLSTFGTLDSDYRGELLVTLYTTAPSIEYTVQSGDRIAQIVITRLVDASFELVDELTDTVRGSGGLGSTGR
ncbi:MAG: dUTP diphosphatase [Anaerolineaceae bacterium]